MKIELLELLRCPETGQRLTLETDGNTLQEVEEGWLASEGGRHRFAEVALKAGAKLVALDYSSAVDACYANLKHHTNLHVVQGDIYALPFKMGVFQFVYSLGVLQHKPDVAKAYSALSPMVRGGGSCAWITTGNGYELCYTPSIY